MERELPTPQDEGLLRDLWRVTSRLDPIPEPALAAARAAIDWRTIDAELAELVADSAIDEPAVLVRATIADVTIRTGLRASPTGDRGRLAARRSAPGPLGRRYRRCDEPGARRFAETAWMTI